MKGFAAAFLLGCAICGAAQTSGSAQSASAPASSKPHTKAAAKKRATSAAKTTSAVGPCTPISTDIDVQVERVKHASCAGETRAGFRNNYSEPVDCVFRWSESSPVGHVKLPVGVAVANKDLTACRANPESFRFVCFPESQAKNGCENKVTWPK